MWSYIPCSESVVDTVCEVTVDWPSPLHLYLAHSPEKGAREIKNGSYLIIA